MELTVTKTENTKINHVSIVDYIEDDRENIHPTKDDWMFYDQYESEYEDVYMTKNLLEEWDAEPTADWYGTHTYWEKWLVNEP